MAHSKAEFKSNDDKASIVLELLYREIIRQIFTCTDFTIRFVEIHFTQPN
jgi:hypothetical protein